MSTPAKSSNELFKVSGKKVSLPNANELAEGCHDVRIETRPGGWTLVEWTNSAGLRMRKRVRVLEQRTTLGVSVSGRLWQGEVQKPVTARAGAAKGSGADLTAQFPGKIRKLLVAAGQTVVEGEVLLLMEAMKMEFAIKAPSAGIVKAWLVKEGDQLAPGARLVDFEETK